MYAMFKKKEEKDRKKEQEEEYASEVLTQEVKWKNCNPLRSQTQTLDVMELSFSYNLLISLLNAFFPGKWHSSHKQSSQSLLNFWDLDSKKMHFFSSQLSVFIWRKEKISQSLLCHCSEISLNDIDWKHMRNYGKRTYKIRLFLRRAKNLAFWQNSLTTLTAVNNTYTFNNSCISTRRIFPLFTKSRRIELHFNFNIWDANLSLLNLSASYKFIIVYWLLLWRP